MKKILTLIAVLLCFATLWVCDGRNTLALSFQEAEVSTYNQSNGQLSEIGDFKLLLKPRKNYTIKLPKNQLNNVLIKVNAKKVNSYRVDNIQMHEYYTFSIPQFRKTNGSKINMQIAEFDDYILIGIPVLVGSY